MGNSKIAILVGGSDLFSGMRGISKGTKIIQNAIRPVFDEVLTINYNYFLDLGRVHQQLLATIQQRYAFSDIFLYGYSKGGDVVLKLSRGMSPKHTVRLLITVDIANGPWSAGIDRSVPVNVVKNINIYQSKPRLPLFSYGLPAYSLHHVEIDNIDLSGKIINGKKVTHSNIEMLMTETVIKAFKKETNAYKRK